LFCEILLGGSLILTQFIPRFRAWPPPDRKSWQYIFTWGLTIVSSGGIFILGILDWNSFIVHDWMRYLVGIGLIILGLILVIWGVRTLGIYATQGLGGEFIREGPYRFSRNPQYLGDIALLMGFILLCNSLMAGITGLLGIVCLILAPYAEEPWLMERFGDAYKDYKSQIPRFISLGSSKDGG